MRYSHILISVVLAAAGMSQATPAFAGNTSKSEKNEKTVTLKDLPAPARETALREATGGKLIKIEEMKKSGATVYEAVIRKGKNELGVMINADGKVLGRHSENSEKDKD